MIRRGLLASALCLAALTLAAPAAAQPVDACDTTHVPDGVSASMDRNLNALADRHPVVGPQIPQDATASVERNVRALYEESGCA